MDCVNRPPGIARKCAKVVNLAFTDGGECMVLQHVGNYYVKCSYNFFEANFGYEPNFFIVSIKRTLKFSNNKKFRFTCVLVAIRSKISLTSSC